MIKNIACLSLTLLSLYIRFSNALHEPYEIEWELKKYKDVPLSRSDYDSVLFDFEPKDHNVFKMESEAAFDSCDFDGAVELEDKMYTFDGEEVVYFACKKSFHCDLGQKVKISFYDEEDDEYVYYEDDGYYEDDAQVNSNLVELISSATPDELNELLSLLVKYNLTDALSSDGPFTVFGPTDAAFEKISDMVGKLSDEEILNILLYHVVPDELFSYDLTNGKVMTLLQEEVRVSISYQFWFFGRTIHINDAKVISPDYEASNGVGHLIDSVLIPPSFGPNIVEIALSAAPEFTTLVYLLRTYNLADTLSGEGPFTVFAPTNAAFKENFGAVGSLTYDEIIQVLLNHVVSGKKYSADLEDGQMVQTLQGGSITVSTKLEYIFFGQKTIYIDESKVIKADIEASNGVIHVIDKVLMPSPNLLELAVGSNPDELNTLVELVVQANLTDTLSSTVPKTVFAPTDAAFELISSILPTLTEDQVKTVLLYHVVVGDAVFSDDLEDGQLIEMANGEFTKVTIVAPFFGLFGTSVYINDAMVVAADNKASNGVAHLINSVLIPPSIQPDIVQVVSGDTRLSTLVTLVTQYDLVSALSSAGPFTVFAPTNEAFEAIADIIPDLSGEIIKNILLYHVVQGAQVYSSDLSDGQEIQTLQGEDVEVSVETFFFFFGTTYFINNAEVVFADVTASNGVVHLINKVLIPPSYL